MTQLTTMIITLKECLVSSKILTSINIQHSMYIDLVRRVHDLNERVEDIQIEQNAQRVSISKTIDRLELFIILFCRNVKSISVINLNL